MYTNRWTFGGLQRRDVWRSTRVEPRGSSVSRREKLEQRQRDDLRENPSRYIVGTRRTDDSGIVNDYCRLAGVTLQNTSRFDVR